MKHCDGCILKAVILLFRFDASIVQVTLPTGCKRCWNWSCSENNVQFLLQHVSENTSPRLRKKFTRTDSAHSCKLTGSNSQNGAWLEHTLQKLWHNNNTITKSPPNNALMVSRWHISSLSRLILSFFFHFVNSYPSILYKSDYLTRNTLW